MATKRASKADMAQHRERILAERDAVLVSAGPDAQALARRLWAEALELEHAILRRGR